VRRAAPGGWIAGVDGCPAGWIVVRQAIRRPQEIDIAIHESFATILDVADPPAVIAVDMPIGLPERIGENGRESEKEVRRHLGRRKSSVFPIPSRSAVYATDYATSCLNAARTSGPSRKVSKQAFNIFPKMREIDALLRANTAIDPPWMERVFEAHPELAFWRLNGERPLEHPKKIRGRPNPDGMQERRQILAGAGLPSPAIAAVPPRGAALDDLLDALALLGIARRLLKGEGRSFPDPPGRDAFGLPIAIWA
jgi:predicted RNase H-like nuclease